MVSIQFRSEHLCNGAILSPTWVVSTARPFYNMTESINRFKAVAGTLRLGNNANAVQVSNISRAVLHPNFYFESNSPVMHNDIAAVEMETPFIFFRTVRNINLPYKSEEFFWKDHGCRLGCNEF
ncbi:hypothetical protein ILUMI_08028 [Ignelater luminosus]|uniref:Peptidase S1 domain-containing protein n=1 Tax=Ignelater luminosus TaxID=2038154 RepID=A0A8K0D7P3_IGNLU|nr:hypothetical protein ILUMI_08028 [Ignelater luminosus]